MTPSVDVLKRFAGIRCCFCLPLYKHIIMIGFVQNKTTVIASHGTYPEILTSTINHLSMDWWENRNRKPLIFHGFSHEIQGIQLSFFPENPWCLGQELLHRDFDLLRGRRWNSWTLKLKL